MNMRTVSAMMLLVLMASVLFVFAECHAENKTKHVCVGLLSCCEHSAPASNHIFIPPHSFIVLKIADEPDPFKMYCPEIEYPPWLCPV